MYNIGKYAAHGYNSIPFRIVIALTGSVENGGVFIPKKKLKRPTEIPFEEKYNVYGEAFNKIKNRIVVKGICSKSKKYYFNLIGKAYYGLVGKFDVKSFAIGQKTSTDLLLKGTKLISVDEEKEVLAKTAFGFKKEFFYSGNIRSVERVELRGSKTLKEIYAFPVFSSVSSGARFAREYNVKGRTMDKRLLEVLLMEV